MFKFFRQLAGLPRLLLAVTIFKTDVQLTFQEPDLQAAWQRFKNDPAIVGVLPRLSSEWRAIEEAAANLK